MPLLNVLTKILRKTVNTQNAVLLESKHRDFSVIAMIHKTQVRHSFLRKTIKRWLENKQKEKEQRERQREERLREAGEARTFCIITHLFHQISQILPRVFANGKKKGKER